MLVAFKNERDAKFDEYEANKKQWVSSYTNNTKFRQKTGDFEDDEYSNLYKKLGKNNRNGDLRVGQQEFLDQYLENRIGPQLWQGCNPNYRLENKMDTTEFSSTFKGRKEEATDKVYFRK